MSEEIVKCRFKVGDKVKVVNLKKVGSRDIGYQGIITSICNEVLFLDNGNGVYECQVELITNNKNMKSIVKFVKEMVLSADEKLLRKYGLKDDCGDWTDDAEDALTRKLMDDNQDYLVGIAKGLQKEEKDEKANN